MLSETQLIPGGNTSSLQRRAKYSPPDEGTGQEAYLVSSTALCYHFYIKPTEEGVSGFNKHLKSNLAESVMKKFELTSDMLTGIDDIDNQHRKLLSWGNDLCFDDTEAAVNKIEEALKNLTRYVSYHFRAEEEAMNRYGYKMLEKHVIQHERLMFDVAKLVVRSKKEGVSHGILVELQDMLIDWFRYHIQEWDRPFATFLKNNNLLTSFSLIEENLDYDWSEIDLT